MISDDLRDPNSDNKRPKRSVPASGPSRGPEQTRTESDAMTADEAERAKAFARRGLLSASWTIPVIVAINLRESASALSGFGDIHGDIPFADGHGDHADHVDSIFLDGGYGDHTDTHADGPHLDVHVDTFADGHGDYNTPTLVTRICTSTLSLMDMAIVYIPIGSEVHLCGSTTSHTTLFPTPWSDRLTHRKEYFVSDEALLYSPSVLVAASLDSSAHCIWQLCDSKHSIAEIAEQLGPGFGCVSQDLLGDIVQSIRKLRSLGLLDADTTIESA